MSNVAFAYPPVSGKVVAIMPGISQVDFPGCLQPGESATVLSLDNTGSVLYALVSSDPGYAEKAAFLKDAFEQAFAVGFTPLPPTNETCNLMRPSRIYGGHPLVN
jgi:hypothetical protein